MKSSYFSKALAVAIIPFAIACNNKGIEISATNPHYFLYDNKPIVFVTTDQHYGAVINKTFDYVKFLSSLESNGFNLTRIYPGGFFEGPDKYIKGNVLGVPRGEQLLPWDYSNQAGANPLLAKEGQPSYKFDLEKWNPDYFARLKKFVETAREKNIIVEVVFFNGMYDTDWPLMALCNKNNIQNVGKYEAIDGSIYTTDDPRNQDVIKYQQEYIKKITTELNAYDNLLFDICDEPRLDSKLKDADVVPWLNKMADAFLEAEKNLPKKHLLGQTVQSLSPDMSNEAWCQWLPTEYVLPADRAFKINYKLNKPIVNVESNYFNASLSRQPYSVDDVRLESWWNLLGGNAGYINLNADIMTGQEEGGEVTKTIIAPRLKILHNFMKSLDFINMKRYTDYTCRTARANAIAETGKQYAIYLFHAEPDTVSEMQFLAKKGEYLDTLTLHAFPKGQYLHEWIDPTTGLVVDTGYVSTDGGDLKFITPKYFMDIVLRIRRKE